MQQPLISLGINKSEIEAKLDKQYADRESYTIVYNTQVIISEHIFNRHMEIKRKKEKVLGFLIADFMAY